ncbi:MAG TPA: RNB domain-containing ribonuclease [Candidatus Binatia bacterium]|nr:RNB domain-containing ribonuclease [Candidatus Binatia bacterium]
MPDFADAGRLSKAEVLSCLGSGGHPLAMREICKLLDLTHTGRRDLKKILKQLVRTREVEEAGRGRFRLPRPLVAAAEAGMGRPAPHARGVRGESPQTQPSHEPAPSAAEPPARRADPNRATGRLVMHRDGYGFLVPEHPVAGVDGDLYVGRNSSGDAMHGDRVLARVERRPQRAGPGRAEAVVLRILERAHPTVVGIFRYTPSGNFVRPFEERLQQEIFIPAGNELTPELRAGIRAEVLANPASLRRLRMKELDGAVVHVELTRFPRGGVHAAGRVIEILGHTGEMGVDVEIIIRKHHLPNRFPPEVAAQAAAVPQEVRQGDHQGRGDFRELPIVTIDGETAKDFDDAVYVARLSGGRWQLQVHIADVAHYVAIGSPLDHEARLRGTSVYFPDRAVPMLPFELSNQICSLNPRVDRLVMSALLEIDAQGETARAEFTPGIIRSAQRMTYTNVFRVLEGEADAAQKYAALAPHFHNMRELALLLNGRRTRRGAIDFDLPEPVIEFDEQGRMKGILRSERNIAHRIIEEFMLAANEAVAAYLEGRGLGLLFRVHEKPDPKKVLEFEELAQAFGHSLGVEDLAVRRVAVRHGRVQPAARGERGRGAGRERPMVVTLPGATEFAIRPQHYQNLTRKIAGRPEERILSYLMLRSLKQARYAADPLGHFALGARDYTHFTSPIRRYPDLIVHRVLKWALAHPGAHSSAPATSRKEPPVPRHPPAGDVRRDAAAETRPGPYTRAELEETALESSEAERRADAAERELMEWKTAQFMEQHLGEEYAALVIGAQKWGVYVELFDVYVEGLIPIVSLEEFASQRCFFRERDRLVVAQDGQIICRLGDRVQVRADRIDPLFRRVEFALVSRL